ncbi:unnamed protein product [Adineta ricciae]|uniref:Uncharacterized protein n=2 Tax=Adineta ricciae TaxID=249248 RepID=A0A815B4L9_ADIRI|nr:unnamed protein product [Adineta ricciae]
MSTSSAKVNEFTALYNTTAGSDSLESTLGRGIGQYPGTERPSNVYDADVQTKYLNFGQCNKTYGPSNLCAINTGFYLVLQGGPLLITIDCNWNIIYEDGSGLQTDPGRNTCGMTQSINNSISYQSYRFLVTSKRSNSNRVQYSEVKLF